MFGSRVRFSGTADLMVQLSVSTNPRWRLAVIYIFAIKRVPHNARPLCRLKPLSYFRHLWTKVHLIKYVCAGEITVCITIFRSMMISCFFVIVILSVRPSVCPSVCHTRGLCPHGSSYDHDFFTIW